MSTENRLNMADVGAKDVSFRRAVARGDLILGPEAYRALRTRTLPKGDALAVAEVAGILAAKRTPETIPLCHPLGLDFVGVGFEFFDSEHRVRCRCEVRCRGVTGAEMEALSGVTAALLSIYDLCKPIDAALALEGIFLESKEGGKSGHWRHPRLGEEKAHVEPRPWEGLKVGVLTVSDSAARGGAADISGPALQELARGVGAEVVEARCVEDDVERIREAVSQLCSRADVVLSTGGTGLGPRDVTPEALRGICIKDIIGIGELLRSSGARYTSASWLSRSLAVLVGQTIVVAFPGKPSAVREGFEAVAGLLPHALRMARGGGHDIKR